MKSTEDVFFFTLIDFLLQVFFFGLVLYVLGQASHSEASKAQEGQAKEVEHIKQVSGFSNLTELSDFLTRLAPVEGFRGLADFLQKAKKSKDIVDKFGGPDKVEEGMEKQRKLEGGSGKPPCIVEEAVPKALATAVADDSTIRFETSTPELEEVLRLLGRSFDSVKVLPLNEFRRVFGPLVRKRPECRYTLRFRERTRYVDARDAAQTVFYLSYIRP